MIKRDLGPAKNPSKVKASYQIIFTLILMAWSMAAFAQEADDKVQMATGLRSSGKIYVVVAVLLTVLTGLILYLIKLDKKISRLEKERNT
jgi:uncharacterized integral membrane protein